jgi:hypothetical protein
MPSYCTLQGARRQLEVQTETQDVDADTDLFFYMLTAAAAIDDYCGYPFDERLDQYGFNGNVGKYNPVLSLRDRPLVAVSSLVNGNGDVIDPANYTLLPISHYPKTDVRLARGFYWRGPSDPTGSTTCSPSSPLLDAAYAVDAVQISGRWVYHRQYLKAWRRITQKVGPGGIDGSATSLPLDTQVGLAFDVGSILRVTTGTATEQMLVTGPIANSSRSGFAASTITVERAYNGTAAIPHVATDVLDVWQSESLIVNIAEMATAALYKGRDNATGDAKIVAGFGGQMVIPVDLPAKIKGFLVPYRSWRYGRP